MWVGKCLESSGVRDWVCGRGKCSRGCGRGKCVESSRVWALNVCALDCARSQNRDTTQAALVGSGAVPESRTLEPYLRAVPSGWSRTWKPYLRAVPPRHAHAQRPRLAVVRLGRAARKSARKQTALRATEPRKTTTKATKRCPKRAEKSRRRKKTAASRAETAGGRGEGREGRGSGAGAQEQRAAEKGRKRLRRRCGEHASLRRKGPRAQATETPQPFCRWYLQCRCCRGKCARQSPAACALRARAVGEEAHEGFDARGHGARVFVAASALARIFFRGEGG